MLLEALIESVKNQGTKFIIVTGGVCSSIGKGILISSIGALLKNSGRSISIMKMDPYLNVDPGTMSPLVHGEVFVTHDGAETDLDLGHYERTLGIYLTKESSLSSGQVFQEILAGERQGKFLGRCIQLIPHVVDAIKQHALDLALKRQSDFLLIEIGGTVGDIEGEVFLEAMRQLKYKLGNERAMHIHLSYVPYLEWANEIKTKPTQHSVILLKKAGIMPDALFLRTEKEVDASTLKKLSVMCGVSEDYLFQVPTCKPVYRLIAELKQQQVHTKIQRYFNTEMVHETDISSWEHLVTLITKKKEPVTIGLIAKYIGSNDPYISVIEAIKSAAWASNREANIVTLEAEKIGDSHHIDQCSPVPLEGVVVPGGFDVRGIHGKIIAAQWARERSIPYFGLCLGLQVMLIEFARSVLGLNDASSEEYDEHTTNPIIALLEEQQEVIDKGSSMRLGAFPCEVQPNTKAYTAYQQHEVFERHRHRYEFNLKYKEAFEESGMIFSGIYKKKGLIEIAELKNHPFMVGTQFHPEFLSTPLVSHPLFKLFIESIIKCYSNELTI